MDSRRVQLLNNEPYRGGPVLYWMSRDQRVHDNWALIYAQEMCEQHNQPLFAAFCLVPDFLNAASRQYAFMLKGLVEVESKLTKLNIPFHLLTGPPEKEIPNFIRKHKIGLLVTDFDPLRIKRMWKQNIGYKISIPFADVDTHNIIPCRVASQKQEYTAATIRRKIHRLLPDFLSEFPPLKKQKLSIAKPARIDWTQITKKLKKDTSVPEAEWIKPGEDSANHALNDFLKKRLPRYSFERNNPVKNAQSDLSPYLHFGHISAQRIALEVERIKIAPELKEPFLEELIVRKELADNLCYYNNSYDSFESFPAWAQKTLNEHRNVKREYLYTSEEFEKAETHDDLWNAAQLQMVKTGKMHGYMRMYWAKKILEWSDTPENALKISIYLNDRYELDGRDPNGYTGIAWSIGGVHDRAWGERPVFGKIRYMSYNGCKSKFDVKGYIAMVNGIE